MKRCLQLQRIAIGKPTLHLLKRKKTKFVESDGASLVSPMFDDDMDRISASRRMLSFDPLDASSITDASFRSLLGDAEDYSFDPRPKGTAESIGDDSNLENAMTMMPLRGSLKEHNSIDFDPIKDVIPLNGTTSKRFAPGAEAALIRVARQRGFKNPFWFTAEEIANLDGEVLAGEAPVNIGEGLGPVLVFNEKDIEDTDVHFFRLNHPLPKAVEPRRDNWIFINEHWTKYGDAEVQTRLDRLSQQCRGHRRWISVDVVRRRHMAIVNGMERKGLRDAVPANRRILLFNAEQTTDPRHVCRGWFGKPTTLKLDDQKSRVTSLQQQYKESPSGPTPTSPSADSSAPNAALQEPERNKKTIGETIQTVVAKTVPPKPSLEEVAAARRQQLLRQKEKAKSSAQSKREPQQSIALQAASTSQ